MRPPSIQKGNNVGAHMKAARLLLRMQTVRSAQATVSLAAAAGSLAAPTGPGARSAAFKKYHFNFFPRFVEGKFAAVRGQRDAEPRQCRRAYARHDSATRDRAAGAPPRSAPRRACAKQSSAKQPRGRARRGTPAAAHTAARPCPSPGAALGAAPSTVAALCTLRARRGAP